MASTTAILLTADEVAKTCRVTARCVTKWAEKGTIPGAMKLGGVWRFDSAAFDNWRERSAAEAANRGRKWDSTSAAKSTGLELNRVGKNFESLLAQRLGLSR
jgi:excisionase family DNA binding protein